MLSNNNKKQRYRVVFYYKSEKSEGKSLVELEESIIDHLELPKIVFQISSIFSKILSGFAYCSTLSQSKFHNTGNKNIVSTVTTIQITAYRIVFIAGLIFSSLPPDKISNKPHHKINTIEKTHANNTNNEIANRIKSPKAIFVESIVLQPAQISACTGSINMS